MEPVLVADAAPEKLEATVTDLRIDLIVLIAAALFCALMCLRSAEAPEQREALYARDGETAEEARERTDIEECTSGEFGLCHPFPKGE